MSDIPSEILYEILLRLPGKSLLRLRCVCKGWRCFIDDPSFIRSHMDNQLPSTTLLIRSEIGRCYFASLDSLNFTDQIQTMDTTPIHCGMPEKSLLLSLIPCNGLILMFVQKPGPTSRKIMNLLTRKRHELRRPPLYDDKNDYCCGGFGFGYDYAADDYKVVWIDRRQRTRIYSLKSDSWRIIGDCPPHLIQSRVGLFLNRKLHWLSVHRIIVLNLETEDYHLLSMPPITKRRLSITHLEALSGQLFCSDHCGCGNDCQYDGWVMNDYDDNSWTKLFSIEIRNSPGWIKPRPVAYFNREKHVLLWHREGFLWVDIESGSVKKITVNGVSLISHSHLCTESLFPLGVTQ